MKELFTVLFSISLFILTAQKNTLLHALENAGADEHRLCFSDQSLWEEIERVDYAEIGSRYELVIVSRQPLFMNVDKCRANIVFIKPKSNGFEILIIVEK